MKIKAFLVAALLLISVGQLSAQLKIGYTNVNLIFAYMPDARSMETQLQTYQKKYAERLSNKEKVMNDLYSETLAMAEKNQLSEEDKNERSQRLQTMQTGLREEAAKYDKQLMVKQQEMMEPIITKLQDAIDAVAKENGYTYVLNTMDASGTSIVLHGPENNDITKLVMTKLGISIPKE